MQGETGGDGRNVPARYDARVSGSRSDASGQHKKAAVMVSDRRMHAVGERRRRTHGHRAPLSPLCYRSFGFRRSRYVSMIQPLRSRASARSRSMRGAASAIGPEARISSGVPR